MKKTEKNLNTLKELGFTNDFEKTKFNPDKNWFSLPCGWGFRIDAIESINELKNIKK